MRYPLTVFYDASCPLCVNEMQALEVLGGRGRLRPLWRALYPLVAANRRLLSRLGASRLMRRLIPKRRPAGCARCARAPASPPAQKEKRRNEAPSFPPF
jgi:hypothetical protein